MGVAIFACVFGLFYKPADYLILVVTLIGAIYLGGVGAVVWGGLYWKKGTTAGVWASMIVGTTLAIAFNIIQPYWTNFYPLMLHVAGHGWLLRYLTAHPNACPIDGQQFSVATAACALIAYVGVSLLTYQEDFNMERMLHRGKYAIPTDEEPEHPIKKGFSWGKLIGIDEHYTLGDKAIAIATFCYAMAWKPITLGNVLYWLLHGRQSDNYWFSFTMVTTWLGIGIAVFTTIWLGIGTIKDLIDLFRALRTHAARYHRRWRRAQPSQCRRRGRHGRQRQRPGCRQRQELKDPAQRANAAASPARQRNHRRRCLCGIGGGDWNQFDRDPHIGDAG